MESCQDFMDERLPTLDLNIWVDAENNTLWSFYSKPMSCNYVIQRESAMPKKNIKITTLNQEVIRRMVNTSEMVDEETKIRIFHDFAQKMVNKSKMETPVSLFEIECTSKKQEEDPCQDQLVQEEPPGG